MGLCLHILCRNGIIPVRSTNRNASNRRIRTSMSALTHVQIPASVGELFDKISILEIKARRIADTEKLRNVTQQLALLREVELHCSGDGRQAKLVAELKRVNEELWEIEDAIRGCERRGDFGAQFVVLARAVYQTNDRRCMLKRKISELHGSDIVEEKSYSTFD
jgi:hypothetical protein